MLNVHVWMAEDVTGSLSVAKTSDQLSCQPSAGGEGVIKGWEKFIC